MVTDINQLDFSKQYTYSDYLTWQFKERVELLRGWVSRMSPAPLRRHQDYSTRIFRALVTHFPEKQCKVYTAPFDVTLPDSAKGTDPEKARTVVQPDLCVVCDKSKLNRRGCNGAPDLVIEILLPGNSKKEVETKYRLYEEAGVREYWLVDSAHFVVTVFDLKEGAFQFRKMYPADAVVPSGIFPEFSVDLKEIFTEEDLREAEEIYKDPEGTVRI